MIIEGISNTTRKEPIDPLKRVFVPIEKDINSDFAAFRTHDSEFYIRNKTTGVITSYKRKVRGKKARHADKLARRRVAK